MISPKKVKSNLTTARTRDPNFTRLNLKLILNLNLSRGYLLSQATTMVLST